MKHSEVTKDPGGWRGLTRYTELSMDAATMKLSEVTKDSGGRRVRSTELSICLIWPPG